VEMLGLNLFSILIIQQGMSNLAACFAKLYGWNDFPINVYIEE
jgi:hypothetical protein